MSTPISKSDKPSGEARFAAAIAGFAQLLCNSKYLGDWTYADAVAMANRANAEDTCGYHAEAIMLIRLTGSLSPE